MKPRLLLQAVICAFALLPSCKMSTSKGADSKSKVVVLKLDDIVSTGEGAIVSDRWVRVTDFLQERNVKAAFGIIGYSLEDDNPAYFKWIKDVAATGMVEFWNHGYWQRTSTDTIGEFELAYDAQLRALQLTDSLSKAKLGITLTAWGPHWSDTTEDTDRALSRLPHIKLAFGWPSPSKYYKGVVIPSDIQLEYPTHNPDYNQFVEAYNGEWKELDSFYLQGHPNSWDDARWENFVKIIDFLQAENVQFVTPQEYVEIMNERKTTSP